jgi:hypothetical protein
MPAEQLEHTAEEYFLQLLRNVNTHHDFREYKFRVDKVCMQF